MRAATELGGPGTNLPIAQSTCSIGIVPSPPARRLPIEATYDLEQWRDCPGSPAVPSSTKIRLARKESVLYARFLYVIMELPVPSGRGARTATPAAAPVTPDARSTAPNPALTSRLRNPPALLVSIAQSAGNGRTRRGSRCGRSRTAPWRHRQLHDHVKKACV